MIFTACTHLIRSKPRHDLLPIVFWLFMLLTYDHYVYDVQTMSICLLWGWIHHLGLTICSLLCSALEGILSRLKMPINRMIGSSPVSKRKLIDLSLIISWVFHDWSLKISSSGPGLSNVSLLFRTSLFILLLQTI